MSKTAKTILAVVLLLVVAAAVLFAYFQWGPPAQKRAEEARRAEAALTQPEETAGEPEPEQPAQAEEAAEPEETGENETTEAARITITFIVVHGDGTQKEFTIVTEAINLREALEQEELIEGTEGEWGLFVQTVDGETADSDQQQWWCLTKSGEMMMTGVDDTVISDGEQYEFTLTVGW